MSDKYRIFGAELSPYSVKVRSYFRYKNIPHEWVVRNQSNMAEFQKHAKLPLVPLVITPEETGIQDSTPIIEAMEKQYPEPSIHPPDPAASFISALLEEYGDEWGNKPMFHYRWHYEPDQESAAKRLAQDNMPDAAEQAVTQTAQMIKTRMVPRLKLVGSSPETKDCIEGSFLRQLRIVNDHLTSRKYLFGNRPAFGDFGVYPQLYQCWTDPTPHGIMEDSAPHVIAWIERMLNPTNEGEFESWDALSSTLMPLLTDEVAQIFFPWTAANAQALAAGEKEFTVDLEGAPFTQGTQKYHAKSLGVLKARYQQVPDKAALDAILKETGCFEWLQS